MRVLLIEDEQRLAENIVAALRETGLAVDHAADGEAGSYLAEQSVYDAIVLDLMLPGKSGQRVLHDLRRKKLHTPVFILTAQEGKESIVSLLNAGADDYLSKPFDLGELLARIKSSHTPRERHFNTGTGGVGSGTQYRAETVRRAGRSLDLSPTEYRILDGSHPSTSRRRFPTGVVGTSLRFRLGASFQCDRSAHLKPAKKAEPCGHRTFNRDSTPSRISSSGTERRVMTGSVSITRRLIATVLVLELLSAVALIGAITVHERHVQLKAFDASLIASAETVMGAVQDAEDEGDNVALDLREVQLPKEAAFRVVDEKGRVLGSKGEPPRLETPLSESHVFRDVDLSGRAYRFLVLHGVRIVDAGTPSGGVRHSITVVYGIPVGHVWHEVLDAIRFFAIATAILLGLTAAVMIWLVRKGLSPVYEIAREAERISPTNWRFEAPVSAKTTVELRPLAVLSKQH